MGEPDDYVVGTLLLFNDDGPDEGNLLHRGTRKSCEQVVELLHAVAYSGDRPVKRAYMPIMPAAESLWDLGEGRNG